MIVGGYNIDNILLSHPRSGNHWVRYVIELLYRKRTLGHGKWEWATTVDAPIFERLKEEDKYEGSGYIAVKRHFIDESDSKENNILCIIRNYKNIMIRRFGRHDSINKDHKDFIEQYINVIRRYDSCPNKKMHIYYEDLVSDTDFLVSRLETFFGVVVNSDIKKEFIENLPIHKEKCISLYGDVSNSNTKGKDEKFYYRKVDNKILKQYDSYVSKTYPYIYNKYLCRYKDNDTETS